MAVMKQDFGEERKKLLKHLSSALSQTSPGGRILISLQNMAGIERSVPDWVHISVYPPYYEGLLEFCCPGIDVHIRQT